MSSPRTGLNAAEKKEFPATAVQYVASTLLTELPRMMMMMMMMMMMIGALITLSQMGLLYQ